MARLVWLVTGIAWAIRSLLEFAHPDYYSPVTALDWSAVWSYSAAWLLFAPAVLFLGRLTSSRSVMAVASVVAIGAVLAGGANALEDGFAVRIGGTPYVVGFMIGWLTLLPLAGLLARARAWRLAALVAALFIGVLLAFGFGGGLIILGGLGLLAGRPGWFVGRTEPLAEGSAARSPA